MKIRLAKKIMKYFGKLKVQGYIVPKEYWESKCLCFELDCKDHRITKAISLTSKKKKYEKV